MDLTLAAPPRTLPGAPTARGARAGDRYLVFLGLVLTGYSLFSRGFAYVGVPPLFIGELTLGVGLVVLARAGRLGPLFQRPTAWLLVGLLGMAVARTLPFLGTYGLDAPRDAMQIGYGVYALIVGGLLVARPQRLVQLLTLYRRYVVIVLSVIWAVYLAYKIGESSLPKIPWAPQATIFEAKGGDIMVQLCGITLFLVLGLGNRTPLVMFALAMNAGIIVVSNRGGMVAYVLGCALGWMLRPPEARSGRLVYAFLVFVALGLVIGPTVKINGGGRDISVEQIWVNVKSVFGQGGEHLDGTKKWRLEWWEKIYDYTVRGEHFWAGKGFGINLAKEDGFDVVKELRSPHNGHMTVLARMGVPGAALWVLLQIAWGLSVLRQWLVARAHERHRWMAVFGVLSAYWLAFLLNAAFDVYLEGPMGGIWYWTVFGVGMAAVWIHAAHPDTLTDADAPLDSDAASGPPPAPAWGWGPAAPGAPSAPTRSQRRGAPARAPRPQPVPAARW